ncbi:cytochrome P450 2F2-like [Clarias magur]|uniref:Cytochrome P450 2F2-like n=1 Tax=Clarias magur TaxID=1594786 RepID=A0A8J4U3P0_CLAMG|nr:cytochrome P450 2F2-like [Clarias magur]
MLGSWILVVFCICLLFFFIRIQRPKNFPPGPRPIPIFGNLIHFNIKNPLKDFEKLAEQYGSVYSVYIGTKPAVVLNGLKAIREALVTKSADFAGRPDNLPKDVTEGKGSSLYPQTLFHDATSNIISLLLFGTRYDYGDETLKVYVRLIAENTKLYSGAWAMIYDALPVVRSWPLPFKKSFDNYNTLKIMTVDMINKHKTTRVPGKPRDLVDCYLDELDKEEIDEVMEGRSQVSFEDRHNMPYTQAMIHECQRVANTVPLSLFHSTTKDTELMNYAIPKGTIVIPNLSSVLSEEGQWKFPHDFNPSNFLNDQGQFEKPGAFFPFSAGSRVCLGEGLARMELFLFLVTLLRRFQFVWPEDAGEPDFTLVFGLTATPKPYRMELAERYGNVYSLYLGRSPAVVLNGLKAIKEALVTKSADFSGRPQNLLISHMMEGKGVILADYGPAWKEHRRFALMTLRNFGLGKESMEKRILGEIEHLVAKLEKHAGSVLNPQTLFHDAASNIIYLVLSGTRYEYGEEILNKYVKLFTEMNKILNGPWSMIYDTLPWVRSLPLPFMKLFKNNHLLKEMTKTMIKNHKTTRDRGEPRDFLDCYLDELDVICLVH